MKRINQILKEDIMIILEYILGRYALFVKHYADKCASVSEEDLKYNIAVFGQFEVGFFSLSNKIFLI